MTEVIASLQESAHAVRGLNALTSQPQVPAITPAAPAQERRDPFLRDELAPAAPLHETVTIGPPNLKVVIPNPTYGDKTLKRLVGALMAQQGINIDAQEISITTIHMTNETRKQTQKEMSQLQKELHEAAAKKSLAAWMSNLVGGGVFAAFLGRIGYAIFSVVNIGGGTYGAMAALVAVQEIAGATFSAMNIGIVVIQAGTQVFKIYYDYKTKQFTGEMELKKHLNKKSADKLGGLLTANKQFQERIDKIYTEMMKLLQNHMRTAKTILNEG